MNESNRNNKSKGKDKGNARGFMLIMCLQFLIVLALLSVAMLRSFGLQERIAGNTRDKERAIAAAQSALQYGETWLSQQTVAGTGTPCNGNAVLDTNTPGALVICSNALTSPTTLPWTYRTEYRPTADMVASSGGGVTGTGDINYRNLPGLYIDYLGTAANGANPMYRITAYGCGGNGTTAAVVQSTYELQMQQGGGFGAMLSLDGL